MKRIALTVLTTAAVVLGAGAAGADEAPQYGPEWQPGPDYTNFEPGPDYGPFQPGYAPGTADLVDDSVGPLVGRLLGGLFG